MTNEIYLSVAQAADLLGISQETLYKEIQSGNLTAIENPDRKRKHQVIAHSELSRRYGNIYIPDGYLEYAGDKSVDFIKTRSSVVGAISRSRHLSPANPINPVNPASDNC